MRITTFFVLAALTGLSISLWTTQTNAAEKAGTAPPYGIEKRIPWTTSRIKGTPNPPKPYRIERVFGKLKFAEPLAMTRIQGTDRLVVAERYGKIFSFSDVGRPRSFMRSADWRPRSIGDRYMNRSSDRPAKRWFQPPSFSSYLGKTSPVRMSWGRVRY